MLIDAHQLPNHLPLSADVCIVGAGAAGITMALDLAKSGLQVLLLESGGLHNEKATQSLYAGSVADERLHCPPDRYRQRRLGGSTSIWGGRCVPFDDVDFEVRPWIAYSGWPITRADLLPYYSKANEWCECGDFAYTAPEGIPFAARPLIENFDSPHFTSDTLERFSRPTNFGRRYLDQLRTTDGLCVVLHANVTSLRLNQAGTRLDYAIARTLSGSSLRIRASRFVLATGGLEVTRLLLTNRDVHSNGIGNDRDVVGRYYMCHLAGTIGSISFKESDAVWHGYDISPDGIYCRRRLALTSQTQRDLRLGNFIGRLHHPRITDPTHRTGLLSLLYLSRAFIPYEYGKRLYGDEGLNLRSVLSHLRNVALDPFGAVSFLSHWLFYRTLAERKFPSVIIRPKANRYSLDFHAEQLPNPFSRVRLGTGIDALDVPRLMIDWRYTPGDVDTVRRSLALLADELKRNGVGHFEYDDAAVEGEMLRYGAYGGHHIGTTRMGTDPGISVVDSDCRVHGVDNMFIASASVFPTSGQANPTLTIVAVGLRLAARLKQLAKQDDLPAQVRHSTVVPMQRSPQLGRTATT